MEIAEHGARARETGAAERLEPDSGIFAPAKLRSSLAGLNSSLNR